MNRLVPIRKEDDIPAAYRATPLGALLRYHDLRAPMPPRAEKPELLIGMCMDSRKHLRIPDNYAFILRTGGANLRQSEFRVSYAIAVGGVRAIALIGHTNCGMSGLAARREAFVRGLVEVGWERPEAEEQFDKSLPTHEVGAEIDFVVSEARRLRALYPKVAVAPMIYRVEDDTICAVRESGGV
ncbi:MAG: carbonic anhydrase [Elusimicrobia bacterium]|nr:carbonic anhydrase [Elusimicrobiota bacterium]